MCREGRLSDVKCWGLEQPGSLTELAWAGFVGPTAVCLFEVTCSTSRQHAKVVCVLQLLSSCSASRLDTPGLSVGTAPATASRQHTKPNQQSSSKRSGHKHSARLELLSFTPPTIKSGEAGQLEQRVVPLLLDLQGRHAMRAGQLSAG